MEDKKVIVMTPEQQEYLEMKVTEAFVEGYNQCRKDLYNAITKMRSPLNNDEK